MKALYIMLCFFISVVCIAQKTPEELARKAFAACLTKKEKVFMNLYPKKEVQEAFFRSVDAKKEFPKEVTKQVYPKGEEGARFGYALFPRAIKEFGINPKDIVFGKSEAVENDIEIRKSGKKVGVVYNKIISLYFTSAGKQYAFVVPNAIVFRGRWYLSDRVVSIHPLDENGVVID
ncbi:hypothetical protein ACLI09_14090 [Flavobacterium sp. RHBU_24]|uniref:hypothetical protein n=1 Tax=Flavobacterium sp. RHBU_24 TaxID=3391185 RepID=UPI00398563D8